MSRRLVAAPLVIAMLVLLAGCGDSSSSAKDPAPTGETTSPSTGACATDGPAASWPDGVPTDVPLPAGSEVQSTTTENDVLRVRFLVPLSFIDAVKLYLAELPTAGYTLGTGDSEASEADIPFTKAPDGQFSLKLSGLSDPCHTQGLLAVGGDADSDADSDPDAG